MTWLSNLEATHRRRKKDLNLTDEMPDERMARVIREFAVAIKRIELGYRLDVIVDRLSSDSKEVVNDTTAPSST